MTPTPPTHQALQALQPELTGRFGDLLAREGGQLICLVGPRESGLTSMIRQALDARAGGGTVLHWEPAPTTERLLLDSLEAEALDLLGPLVPSDRPDVLPRSGLGPGWIRVLEGTLRALARSRPATPLAGAAGPALVLDDVDLLRGTRRRLPGEVAESWRRSRAEAGDRAPHLVLAGRTRGELAPWLTALRSEVGDAAVDEAPVLEVEPPGYRRAGWIHLGPGRLDDPELADPEVPDPELSHPGARARAAFLHWAFLGARPGGLSAAPAALAALPGSPQSRRGAEVEFSLRSRVLGLAGDLHGAPSARLDRIFQSPGRYVALLGAAARGARSWGELSQAVGLGPGNRIAPYRERLEETGLLVSRTPLGAGPGTRRTRYRVADPLDAFWLGFVLPRQSALRRLGPAAFLRRLAGRPLEGHVAALHAVAARAWVRSHARELLPAEPREAGGIWGGDGELEVAALLTNGQVCHGVVQQPGEPASAALMDRLEAAAQSTRYGIGREGRIPLLFLRTEPEEGLRRRVARDPLARIVGWRELMGPDPHRAAS